MNFADELRKMTCESHRDNREDNQKELAAFYGKLRHAASLAAMHGDYGFSVLVCAPLDAIQAVEKLFRKEGIRFDQVKPHAYNGYASTGFIPSQLVTEADLERCFYVWPHPLVSTVPSSIRPIAVKWAPDNEDIDEDEDRSLVSTRFHPESYCA